MIKVEVISFPGPIGIDCLGGTRSKIFVGMGVPVEAGQGVITSLEIDEDNKVYVRKEQNGKPALWKDGTRTKERHDVLVIHLPPGSSYPSTMPSAKPPQK